MQQRVSNSNIRPLTTYFWKITSKVGKEIVHVIGGFFSVSFHIHVFHIRVCYVRVFYSLGSNTFKCLKYPCFPYPRFPCPRFLCPLFSYLRFLYPRVLCPRFPDKRQLLHLQSTVNCDQSNVLFYVYLHDVWARIRHVFVIVIIVISFCYTPVSLNRFILVNRDMLV